MEDLVVNSVTKMMVTANIASLPLTRSAYQLKSSGWVGGFQKTKSGRYSLTISMMIQEVQLYHPRIEYQNLSSPVIVLE